jgi:hypothetical protein
MGGAAAQLSLLLLPSRSIQKPLEIFSKVSVPIALI